MIPYAITEATHQVVDHITENLWERGREELALIGVPPEMMAPLIDTYRQSNQPTMAVWIDGVPVFMAGLVSTGPAMMCTWFQATEAFTRHARLITTLLRRRLEYEAEQRGLSEIEIHSPCVHPKSGKWFGLLGFDLDVNYYLPSNGGARLYRFVRRFSKGS